MLGNGEAMFAKKDDQDIQKEFIHQLPRFARLLCKGYVLLQKVFRPRMTKQGFGYQNFALISIHKKFSAFSKAALSLNVIPEGDAAYMGYAVHSWVTPTVARIV